MAIISAGGLTGNHGLDPQLRGVSIVGYREIGTRVCVVGVVCSVLWLRVLIEILIEIACLLDGVLFCSYTCQSIQRKYILNVTYVKCILIDM